MGSLPPATFSFSAAPETASFDGLLFDFDGTIIDSTAAIVKHWHKIAGELGVSADEILATSHGRRSIDVLQLYDASRANWTYVKAVEGRIPIEYGRDATELPGARKLLASLDDAAAPWAVVTSGTSALVDGWINILKLARPKNMVVAEDVERGKPDPACYLLGRKRLGLDAKARILVIEDAPSGVRAGKAAGFMVLGLATSHTVQQVKDAGADWVVRDLASVKLLGYQDRVVSLEIRDALIEE